MSKLSSKVLHVITWDCIRRGSEEGNGKTNGHGDKSSENQTPDQPKHLLPPYQGLVEFYSDLTFIDSDLQ